MGSSSFCPKRAWRAAFGNGFGFFSAVCYIVTDIESTVTGTERIQIRIPVIAGTDDIEILSLFTGREPARACTVPVALFVFHQAGDKIFGKLKIRIQVVASILCFFLQDMAGRYHILLPDLDQRHLPELLPDLLLAKTHNTLSVINNKGGK